MKSNNLHENNLAEKADQRNKLQSHFLPIIPLTPTCPPPPPHAPMSQCTNLSIRQAKTHSVLFNIVSACA